VQRSYFIVFLVLAHLLLAHYGLVNASL